MNSINVPKEEFRITMEDMDNYGLQDCGVLTKHWCTLPLSEMVRVWNMAMLDTSDYMTLMLPLPNQANVYAYYDEDGRQLCAKYFEDSMHFVSFLTEDWFVALDGLEQLLEDNAIIRKCYPQWYADK